MYMHCVVGGTFNVNATLWTSSDILFRKNRPTLLRAQYSAQMCMSKIIIKCIASNKTFTFNCCSASPLRK